MTANRPKSHDSKSTQPKSHDSKSAQVQHQGTLILTWRGAKRTRTPTSSRDCLPESLLTPPDPLDAAPPAPPPAAECELSQRR